MSSKQIKGLTVEIGGETSKLEKALEGVNKTSKSLSSELGSINRLLKLDPTNTELLAQKQKILSDAISNTEEKLKILKEAEKQAQAQFEKGEISAEQYRALQREVIATEAKLKQYKKAAEETAQAAEKLADGADHAAHELEDQKKETQNTERATKDLDDSMGDAVKGGFTALIGAATAAIAAIAALAESTREYRTEMGKLDTAYKTSGHSSQTATAAYKELQSVIGETDQAVEAAQQIALLADSAEDVAEWSGLAAGLVGRLGDALQPETFYEAANEVLKLGESTSAWTQMLEQTGIMTVEDFNEGLAACTTTEEKQAYMLDVAKRALGSAATQYKTTNKEIIRANKANEEWNATLAEAGEIVEPVVTDVKELGSALLKQAKQPLKEVATYIRNTFLPNLVKVGSWAGQNLPKIATLTAEVAATVVLFKTAVLSAELATKGLTIATIAQQAAQKALNLIMNANPYVLMATAMAGVAVALTSLSLAMDDSVQKADTLSSANRKLIEESHAAAESFREQQAAAKEAMEGTVSQMGHIQDLADELLTLANASGVVQEKDQARANFILGQLNAALGTEYSMVDGVIQKYNELKGSIDDVIASRLANALLDDAEQGYVEAVKAKNDALTAMTTAEKAYQEEKQRTADVTAKCNAEIARLEEKQRIEQQAGNRLSVAMYSQKILALQSDVDAQKTAEAEKKTLFETAAANYENYANTIITFTQAQTAASEGNYELVKDLLVKESQAYIDHGLSVESETKKTLDTLYRKAIEAEVAASIFKQKFESGTAGFTEEMVKEAEIGYRMAMDAYTNAWIDAYEAGQDVGSGFCSGMGSTVDSVAQSAANMASTALQALRKTLDSHSPAKKTIDIGEDAGDGAVIGIDNKTKDVARAGERQAEALLDAYRSQELRGQNTLIGIADKQAAAQAGSYVAAGAQNAGVLNEILVAIEKGQILTINGDLLVGATEGTMDSALGARQILAERGAL